MAPGHESSFPKHESQPPSDPDIKSETPSPPQSIHYFGAPTRSRLAETRPSGVGSPGSSRPSPEATINNKTRQSRRAACPRFVATSTEESSHIEDSTKSLTRELPPCDDELQAVWQTLKSGYRGLESAHLAIKAMNITAQRAADRSHERLAMVEGRGNLDMTSTFRARRYLRRTRSLLEKVESSMRMLVQEEPKLLRAICVEKKRLLRIAKSARRSAPY